MPPKVWAQNYRPRKISNPISTVIRRQIDKVITLTTKKLKENNPGHDLSVRYISYYLAKDSQYRSCCTKFHPLLSQKKYVIT